MHAFARALARRAFFAACTFAFVATVFFGRSAYGQSVPSVTGISGTVLRIEPKTGVNADDANQNPHPDGVPDSDINFADCQADLSYEFTLLIANPSSSYDLNVWAGTQDCSQLANRQSADSVCWPVTALGTATQNPTTVKVRMQDIVSQLFDSSHDLNYSAASNDVCQGQTTTGSTSVSLYFFFAVPGQDAVGSEYTYPLTVGLKAAGVAGNISVGIGDTLLIVNVPSTSDPSVLQWNVYCDPPPSQATTGETTTVDAASNAGVCTTATTTSDAGVDASSAVASSSVKSGIDDAGGNSCGVVLNDADIPSPGGCTASSVLVAGGSSAYVDDAGETLVDDAGATYEEGGTASYGTMRLIPSKYLCGSGAASSTEIEVRGLKDGNYYNVAVGAVDALGNIGPLSNVECAEPVPVEDFWKRYGAAGGQAGGGFCSTQGAGAPAGTTGLSLLTVASAAAIARRRRAFGHPARSAGSRAAGPGATGEGTARRAER